MGFQEYGGVFTALPETLMNNRPPLAPLVLLFTLLAASCATAPVTWEKPGGTNDHWVKDKVACQFKARREAEKRFRQRAGGSSTSGFRDDTLSRDMSQFDAQRDERRLFEGCLSARGYSKKKAAPPKK